MTTFKLIALFPLWLVAMMILCYRRIKYRVLEIKQCKEDVKLLNKFDDLTFEANSEGRTIYIDSKCKFDDLTFESNFEGRIIYIDSKCKIAPSLCEVYSIVDPLGLAGVHYTGNSADAHTALMNFQTFGRLVNKLNSNVHHALGVTAGLKGLEVEGPRGPIKCFPCTFVGNDKVHLFTDDELLPMSDDELKKHLMKSLDRLANGY